MKVEKFKVLLYLKRSGLDKSGKAPIMGRITVNRGYLDKKYDDLVRDTRIGICTPVQT